MVRVEIEKNEIKREGDEENRREKRIKEGNNKKSEDEMSAIKDLSYPPIHVEKKDVFSINCFLKIILQDGQIFF